MQILRSLVTFETVFHQVTMLDSAGTRYLLSEFISE